MIFVTNNMIKLGDFFLTIKFCFWVRKASNKKMYFKNNKFYALSLPH